MAERDAASRQRFSWPRRLLRWLVNDAYLEELEGDLDEEYRKRCSTQTSVRARFGDVVDTISMIRPYNLRYPSNISILHAMAMLRHYLTSAFRSARRNGGYTLLNILGLTLGMTCFLLIGLFVFHHLSYDSFHEQADRIYRLVKYRSNGEMRAGMPAALAPHLDADRSEIRNVVRVSGGGAYVVLAEPTGRPPVRDKESGGLYVDPEFLTAFSFRMLQGDPATALDDPSSVVLSRSMAQKYFGTQDPVGQMLTLDNDDRFTISAVIDDPPSNSTITFKFLLPWELMRERFGHMYEWQTLVDTYIVLEPDANPLRLAEDIPATIAAHTDRTSVVEATYRLQPLTAMHLEPAGIRFADQRPITPVLLRLFGTIGLFILVIAGINYVNLATARTARRRTEIGLRKAVGANRFELMLQLLTESVLMSMSAMILAVGATLLAASHVSGWVGATLSTAPLFDGRVLGTIVSIGVFFGLAAGVYPALRLSGFRPVVAFAGGQNGTGRSGSRIRKGLVVLQFTTSVAMITGVLVIRDQMQYIRDKDLGFQAEDIVAVSLHGPGVRDLTGAITDRFESLASVESVSLASTLPGRSNVVLGLKAEESSGALEEDRPIDILFADAPLLDALDVELVRGRALSAEYEDAGRSALVNETTVRVLGWDDPIGQTLPIGWGQSSYTVVGVIEDFHMNSLRSEIGPLAVLPLEDFGSGYVAVETTGSDVEDIVTELKSAWSDIVPTVPFDYYFLDDYFASLYETERRQSRLFSLFTGLAAFIACLGLVGLAAYSAEQRRREIGIRKVLGASTGDVLRLLNREYVLLMVLGYTLGIPIAYVLSKRWLESFAYRTSMEGDVFAFSLLAITALTALAVGYQSIRSALGNPVETIRAE